MRLTEQFLHSDPPTAEELSQAVSVVRDQLADVGRALPGRADAPTLVGTAGTVWTLAAIELGVDAGAQRSHRPLPPHPRRGRGGLPDARDRADRSSAGTIPGLEPGRVDVIVGGAIVVVSVMRHWGFDELLVSEADILDGLARDTA